jgi:actin-related protein 6
MIFEEFEFAAYCRHVGVYSRISTTWSPHGAAAAHLADIDTGPAFNAYNDVSNLFGGPPRPLEAAHLPTECLLLIDSGYSHTMITPLINGRPVQQAIRRLDIGGKFLTNFLKEQLSVQQLNVMDETYMVNELKETTCFVSDDFRRDLERTWKGGMRDRRILDPSIVVEYVLPDYETVHKGIVRPHNLAGLKRKGSDPELGPKSGRPEPFVTLGNQRFLVPELLFNPSDIGMKEAGLPTVIMESLDAMPAALRPAMLANVVLVGGNVLLPGFVERLLVHIPLPPKIMLIFARTRELRQLAPSEYNVRVVRAPEYVKSWSPFVNFCLINFSPTKSTWLGASVMANHRETLSSLLVTREEYLEHGGNWVLKKFATSSR